MLPSPFLPDDAALALEKCLKNGGRSSAHVFCGSIVASEKFIEVCIKPFEKLMQEKAEKVRKISHALVNQYGIYIVIVCIYNVFKLSIFLTERIYLIYNV